MSLNVGGDDTRDHGVESFQVLVGHAALVADFVHEAVDETHHRVGHVRALGILKAALCVITLRHAPCNTTRPQKKKTLICNDLKSIRLTENIFIFWMIGNNF